MAEREYPHFEIAQRKEKNGRTLTACLFSEYPGHGFLK
jgi:hypothetical protein